MLADNAVSVSQIDAARAKESMDLITTRIAELPAGRDAERDEMVRDLEWAQTQIRVAERRGGK